MEMNERKIILIGGGTPYTPQVSRKAWNNLTPIQQIECLEQAQRGDCSPPSDIPIGFWKAATHHMKYEGLAKVGHIEGGECETIRLTDLGEAYLMQAKAKTQTEKRETAAAKRLASQELQEVKPELEKAGLILEGQWEGTPAEFGCLVLELFEQHKVANNGGKAWKDCAKWAGYTGSINAARNAIDANPNTRGDNAETIRRICRKK